MKKFLTILLVAIALWLVIFIYAKYFWKGSYIQNGWQNIRVQLRSSDVEFTVSPISSANWITAIDTRLDISKRKIYVWYYAKFVSLLSGQGDWGNTHINIPGEYTVIYLNPDGTEQFIQTISIEK